MNANKIFSSPFYLPEFNMQKNLASLQFIVILLRDFHSSNANALEMAFRKVKSGLFWTLFFFY